MLIVFNAQQFSLLRQRRLEDRLIALLTDSEPEAAAVLAEPEGRAELHRQCERARGYGLENDHDLARYVIAAWLMGTDFDERIPAMADVLGSVDLHGSEKAQAIEQICTAIFQALAREP